MSTIPEILATYRAVEDRTCAERAALQARERALAREQTAAYDAAIAAITAAKGWTRDTPMVVLAHAAMEPNAFLLARMMTRQAAERIMKAKETEALPLIDAFKRALSVEFYGYEDGNNVQTHLRSATVLRVLRAAGHTDEEIRRGCDVWAYMDPGRAKHLWNLTSGATHTADPVTMEQEVMWIADALAQKARITAPLYIVTEFGCNSSHNDMWVPTTKVFTDREAAYTYYRSVCPRPDADPDTLETGKDEDCEFVKESGDHYKRPRGVVIRKVRPQ
jgi:hypothetical protein